jgi:tRNA 2-thiouridine synthesizing protein D
LQFSILITAAPYTSQASCSAYHFAKAVIAKNHQILQVFFYQDGVNHANNLIYIPTDELQIITLWQKLAEQHQFELAICSTSALLRGIVDETFAEHYEKTTHNFNPAFKMSSLTQMYSAAAQANRFITFGN